MTFNFRGRKSDAGDRPWRMRHYVQRRDRTICPRRNRQAARESAPDKPRSTMILVNKVFFEQVFMNTTLWVWGRYGIAVAVSILLGVPAVAVPSAIKISQGGSQQSGENPATATAKRAFTEGLQLYQQGTAESLRKAIAKWEEALKLYREAGDTSGQASSLFAVGRVYSDLGENQKALEYYSQSLPLIRAVGDRAGEAAILTNIGSVYSELGEKQKALEYYSQSLALFRVTSDRRGEAATLHQIGDVYSDLGEKQKALEYYNNSLFLFRSVGDRRGEATTLSGIGNVYDKLGQKQKALEYYNQSLPLRQATGDRSGEALTLNNIGAVYSDVGEKQKALEYYSQSLPLFRALGDRSGEAAILNNIGAVYSDVGEKQKALEYYSQSLPLFRATGVRSQEAVTLYNIADVKRNQGNLTEALTNIESSLKIIESLRTKIASPELRTSYFATVQNYYQFYIDLLMQLHKTNPKSGYDTKAFEASERSRARSLLELLQEANADIRQGVSPELLQKERSLQQQLDALEKQRIEVLNRPNHTPAQEAELEKQRQNLLAQYQDIQTQIRTTSPRYAALTQPQPLTLAQIQQQILDDQTILLQYSLGKDRSYLWA